MNGATTRVAPASRQASLAELRLLTTPHSDFMKIVDRFLELPLSNEAKRKFLWDNWVWLYGFEG